MVCALLPQHHKSDIVILPHCKVSTYISEFIWNKILQMYHATKKPIPLPPLICSSNTSGCFYFHSFNYVSERRKFYTDSTC